VIHLEWKRQYAVRVAVTPGVTYRVVAAAWGPGVQVQRRERMLDGDRRICWRERDDMILRAVYESAVNAKSLLVAVGAA
jgi:hypothetical protein